MTQPRTEGAALSGVLHVAYGGRPVEVPVLTIEQSERWQRLLADTVATALPGDASARTTLNLITTLPTVAMTVLAAAYETYGACPEACPQRGVPYGEGHEHIGVLGGLDAIRRRATAAEAWAMVRAMFEAEYPFVRDLRSLWDTFGTEIQAQMQMFTAREAERYLRESSPPTPSGTGGSTPVLSGVGSPVSSSPSSGEPTSAASRNGATPA